jgi:hypothetical protein
MMAIEHIMLWAAALCWGIAGVIHSRRPNDALWPTLLGSSATAISLYLIVTRWIAFDAGPFLTLYEILLSNLFSLGAISLLLYWRHPWVRYGWLPTTWFLALLAIWATRTPMVATPLPPTFDNPWLWVHVISGKIYLGFLLVATSVAVRILARSGATNSDVPRDIGWRLVNWAFAFDSLMLVSGAAWAHTAWGQFWQWDPLETSTLINWLVLGFTLHLRRTYPLQQRWGLALLVLVFALAVMTFFGIPFLSTGPHQGYL